MSPSMRGSSSGRSSILLSFQRIIRPYWATPSNTADDIFSDMQCERVIFHLVALCFEESNVARHKCRRIVRRCFRIATKCLKMPPRCSSMLAPTGKPEADDGSGGGRHLAQRCGRAPSPAPPICEACCRFHPAAGVFLLDLGCSKIMTIASVSVMKMITITTPRGVTIGWGFRMMRGRAT